MATDHYLLHVCDKDGKVYRRVKGKDVEMSTLDLMQLFERMSRENKAMLDAGTRMRDLLLGTTIQHWAQSQSKPERKKIVRTMQVVADAWKKAAAGESDDG